MRSPAPQQTRASRDHRHSSHTSHTSRTKPSHDSDRRRGIAAALLPTPPLHGASVMLLLGVIAVFGIGVVGIVLAGGRRGQPATKHPSKHRR